jgi:hypothetical protein
VPITTVASSILISPDGFYEGPNGEFDWPVVDEEFDDFAVNQLDEAETLGDSGAIGQGRSLFEGEGTGSHSNWTPCGDSTPGRRRSQVAGSTGWISSHSAKFRRPR